MRLTSFGALAAALAEQGEVERPSRRVVWAERKAAEVEFCYAFSAARGGWDPLRRTMEERSRTFGLAIEALRSAQARFVEVRRAGRLEARQVATASG